MSNKRNIFNDEGALIAEYARMKARLREGGPIVDLKVVEDYVDGALDPITEQVIRKYVTTYRDWAVAVFEIRTIVPEVQGDAVDYEKLALFRSGRLPGEEVIVIRRNIRLYRNWYDAANGAD